MRPSAAALLACALLAACARDLELPPALTAPRVDAVTPAAAHGGEKLLLTGAGFAADPAANLVQFARGQARGQGFEGDALAVRVPPDAGSGPLTVATAGGTSAPAGPFEYRGLGELRIRAVAEEVPLLHKPYRLLAAAGDTWLHSDLLLGVIRYGDPAFVAPLATSIDAAPWAGAVVSLDSDYAATPRTSTLVRMDAATGVVAASAALDPFAGLGPVVAIRAAAADVVAVFRQDDAGVSVALHDLATLAVARPGAFVSVAEVRACAAAGAVIACLARETAGGPLGLARIALPGLTPGASSPDVSWAALPAGATLLDDPVDYEGPLCAGTDAVASPIAVVALDDGRIAAADLVPAPPVLRAPVATGSRTPARSLACAGGGIVIAPKTADDLVAAVDLATGQVRWAAPVPRASRAAVDAGVVHAAGDADNRVALLDLATGGLLGRRAFDVGPGRPGAVQGAAFVAGDAPAPDELVFTSASPPGVIELPLQAVGDAFPLYAASDAIAVVPSWSGALYLPVGPQRLADVALGAPAQLGLTGPTDAYAGTDAGLAAVHDGVLAVSPLDAPEFRSLVLLPDGQLAAAVATGSGAAWSVRAWSEAGAAAGAPAAATWTAPGALAGAAVLDRRLWAFSWDADQVIATELSPALAPLRTVPLGDVMFQPVAVSPNGRTFVSWDFQPFSADTAVVIWSGDPALGFPRLATVPLAGAVTGVAFDRTGEKLYVVTRGPDRIVVLE